MLPLLLEQELELGYNPKLTVWRMWKMDDFSCQFSSSRRWNKAHQMWTQYQIVQSYCIRRSQCRQETRRDAQGTKEGPLFSGCRTSRNVKNSHANLSVNVAMLTNLYRKKNVSLHGHCKALWVGLLCWRWCWFLLLLKRLLNNYTSWAFEKNS